MLNAFIKVIIKIVLTVTANVVKKDLSLTCLKRKEMQKVLFAILLFLISIQHMCNTLP